jgi:hypothetical protein
MQRVIFFFALKRKSPSACVASISKSRHRFWIVPTDFHGMGERVKFQVATL